LRQLERERAQKRGGGAIRGESAFLNRDGDLDPKGLEQLIAAGPTPEFEAAAREQFVRLLDLLDKPDLREVVRMRIEGYTVEEIAGELGRNTRSIERKLNLIRSLWSQAERPDGE
jgi:DNA-directed RNA polymerase specialized sigma24 family protein